MMDRSVFKPLRITIGLGILLLVAGNIGLAQGDPEPGDANRALVRYAEGSFELVALSPLTSFVLPSDELPQGADSLSGFWYEVQDADGETVYRRIIGDPVRLVFEGPAAASTLSAARMSRRLGTEPGRRRTPFRLWQAVQASMLGAAFSPTIIDSMDRFDSRITRDVEPLADPERIEAIPEERHFTLLIPAAQEGDELVLFSSPIELGTQAQPAAEVARFGLQAGQ